MLKAIKYTMSKIKEIINYKISKCQYIKFI